MGAADIPKSSDITLPSGLRPAAEVYIIEALRPEDYAYFCADGIVLENQLRLIGCAPTLKRVYSIDDLRQAVQSYDESGYRFLHISCHGSEDRVEIFGKESLTYSELAKILKGHVVNSRLTFSACSLGNRDFAEEIFGQNKGLHSVLAPIGETPFDLSSVLWISFYTLLFRKAHIREKRTGILSVDVKSIERITRTLCATYGVDMMVCKDNPMGDNFLYEECRVKPFVNVEEMKYL